MQQTIAFNSRIVKPIWWTSKQALRKIFQTTLQSLKYPQMAHLASKDGTSDLENINIKKFDVPWPNLQVKINFIKCLTLGLPGVVVNFAD